jgi:hypothetical protein
MDRPHGGIAAIGVYRCRLNRTEEVEAVHGLRCLHNRAIGLPVRLPRLRGQDFSDGRVRHSGPTFEHTGGADESRIDRRGLTQIAQALRNASFGEMRDSYQERADGCENTFTDMSTLSLSVSRGRGYRNKSVVLYTGCLGPTVPTERINTLIKDIDQVTGTGALLERRKQARQSGGGHSRTKNASTRP